MPSVRCYNKGCGKVFDTEDNGDKSCRYHPGEPYFHDAKKQWTCCKKYSTDFSDFLILEGCTVGPHNPDKPRAVEEPKPKVEIDPTPPPKPIVTKPPIERPSSDAPLQKLSPQVLSSLKKSLESLRKEGSSTSGDSENGVKNCHNSGCKAVYHGIDSDTETCFYHPGVPVFHEGCKYWSCCQRKTTEFEAFLDQPGCTSGRHSWTKEVEAATINAMVVTPTTSQCRFDWFQMSGNITLSVYAKNIIPESVDVRCNEVFLNVSLVYDGGKALFERGFNLYGVSYRKSTLLIYSVHS
ncbi:unnamed protein product [Hymenolepis diminuta]|uniref:CHORD domain-containing protein n=1 Tax=Hymenolepis diminuta TaxID=6216 RepID=A0A0R3SPM8_HYMDI|nr:unnamed protein product [Hymenolepis diminuta]